MKEVLITKASAVREPVDDMQITVNGFADTDRLSLQEVDLFYREEAQRLFDALYSSLPGGTFDRLLGLMLAKKASHLIISHREGDR